MRFSVPQFIEVEDKIIGPLTLKQGIYIVGSLAFAVSIFLKFGFFVAVIFGLPVLLLAFLLAFVKVHGRPFVHVLASAFFYVTKNKLYLWKKTDKVQHKTNIPQQSTPPKNQPTPLDVNRTNLKKLAWTLDTDNPFEKSKKH
jgi:PrgI family protein